MEEKLIIPTGIVNSSTKTAIAKTLYNYIENDAFHEITRITVMDLRRQVSRKVSKKESQAYKKRADRKYLKGRT